MPENNYPGAEKITANGGQGGTEDDGLNINHCYGSGGGGSGGVIYFSGSVPGAPVSSTVTGGIAGPEVNHDVSCSAAVGSSAGTAGQVISNYTFRASLVLSNSYCTILLPVELAWFSAYYSNGQAILNWKTMQPELIDRFVIERSNDADNWTALFDQGATDGLFIYRYKDVSPKTGDNYYRLKIIKKNGVTSYSAVRKIYVPRKNELIAIYPNPADKKISISGITGPTRFDLFDPAGKLIWQKNIIPSQNIVEIYLPALKTGIYFARIGATIQKLVIR